MIMWLHDLSGCDAPSHRSASLQTPKVTNALAALAAPLSDFPPDATTSGGSRAKLGIFKPQWRAKFGYLGWVGWLAIDRIFHHLKLHLHHYALLQSTEKVIPNAEAHHRAGATDCWQKQDNWCAPLSAQINKHWHGYSRKFGKENRGSERSSSGEEPDTKAPRAGWSEKWLLAFQRVTPSTGPLCSNSGTSMRLLRVYTYFIIIG